MHLLMQYLTTSFVKNLHILDSKLCLCFLCHNQPTVELTKDENTLMYLEEISYEYNSVFDQYTPDGVAKND